MVSPKKNYQPDNLAFQGIVVLMLTCLLLLLGLGVKSYCQRAIAYPERSLTLEE